MQLAHSLEAEESVIGACLINSGAFDEAVEVVGPEDFFNEILQPVLDRDHVDDESIEWIINSGFAHNEELLEANRERQSQQEIIRRVRSD